jgi:hypothetical protein
LIMLFSDESTFHISGKVHRHNVCIWGTENPYYAIPVQGLMCLEETAIYVMLASGPVKILAFYFSPSWPMIDLDLPACFGSGDLVLMVGDLSAKHLD